MRLLLLYQLCSALLGIVLVFAFAPFNLFWITPLTVGAFYLLYQSFAQSYTKKWPLFFLGWSFGFGLFAANCHWIFFGIYDHSSAGFFGALSVLILLLVYLAVFYGLFVLGFAWCHRFARSGLQPKVPHDICAALLFSSLFVLLEHLRGWILSGFPWLYLGYSFIDTPLAGYAPILGILGIDWFLVCTAVLSAQIIPFVISFFFPGKYSPERWKQNSSRVIQNLCLIISIWCGGYALQHVDWTQPDTTKPPLWWLMVQPDIAQQDKWNKAKLKSIQDRHVALSNRILIDTNDAINQQAEKYGVPPVSIMVWPEASLPLIWDPTEPFLHDFIDALPANTWLLTGILSRTDGKWFNNAVLLEPENKQANQQQEGLKQGARQLDVQFYYKRKLVPLGEFIPFADWLRPLRKWFSFSLSGMHPGPADQKPLVVDDYVLSPFICYEIIFPDLVTRSLNKTNYLLTISNDAWFGRSIGPHQHMQIARMRALENGLPLIRVTNTGISVTTDHKGKVIKRLPAFTPTAGYDDIMPRTGNTPFHYLQSRTIVMMSILIIVSICLRQRFYAKKRTAY